MIRRTFLQFSCEEPSCLEDVQFRAAKLEKTLLQNEMTENALISRLRH